MKRFRYMLANLISGGELERLRARLKNESEILNGVRGNFDFVYKELNSRVLEVEAMAEREQVYLQWRLDRDAALQQIIACDTPGGNATVKRMVRIARGALE